jgi:hypothetical protein
METNCITRDNFGMYANSASGPGPSLMGANTLLGNDVYNKDGEDLGDKLVAVPWAALALDTTNKRFTLNVLKDALKDAPASKRIVGPRCRTGPGPAACTMSTARPTRRSEPLPHASATLISQLQLKVTSPISVQSSCALQCEMEVGSVRGG